MRWLFIDPTNRREAAYRAEKLRAIDAWWRAFQSKADDIVDLLEGRAEWDLAGWMHDTLGPVDPRLKWEFGPAVGGAGRRLVITPESERWLRPLVGTLLERAPEASGWEFYAYRLPEPAETAVDLVEARTGNDIRQATASADVSGSGRVDLEFTFADCENPLDAEARTAAFLAAETLLGEERFDTWVGEVGVAPAPRRGLLSSIRRAARLTAGSTPRQLAELRPTVDRLIEGLLRSLPDRPCHEFIHQTPWATFTFEPRKGDDYPRRDDLLVAISGRSDVLQAAHAAALFHSRCFSRHGELFCYLKIDAERGLAGSRFADRAAIEDALNEALVAAGAGCVIGGGTGLRYCYVDLALMNLSRGRRIVRDVLLAGEAPRRTWLLFFDAAWSAEWIGIYDDAEPPPE